MSINKKNDNQNLGADDALSSAMKQINDTYGSGSVMICSDDYKTEKIEAFSTGSLLLDSFTGIGGVPVGRITEIYGHEGSAKTTLTLQVIANAQKKGRRCAFIDVEHALDMAYASQLGVDVSKLVLSQPGSGNEALEISDKLVRSGAISVLVIDSVAALVPEAELKGEMGDAVMGGQARLMSQALRKMTASISKSNVAVIFINQIRSKIGVMFGNPETTAGGYALKFYSSLRLEIKKKALIKKGVDIIGQETEVKICKNKFAPPFKTVMFELIYGKGINNYGELVDLALAKNILVRSGSWFSYKDNKIAQGKEAASAFLKENQEIYQEIFEQVFPKE